MKLKNLGSSISLALLVLASSACAHTGGRHAEPGEPVATAPADELENDEILETFDPPEEAPPRDEEAPAPQPAGEAAETDPRRDLDKKEEKEDLILSTLEGEDDAAGDRPVAPETAAEEEPAGGAGADEVVREDPILSSLDEGGDARTEKERKKAERKKKKAEKKLKKEEKKRRKQESGKEEDDPSYEDDIRG